MASENKDKLEAQIKSSDMPEDLQQEAIEVAMEAMEKFNIEKGTDSREPSGRAPARRLAPATSSARKPAARLISVDSVLQYATDIPSGQRRGPPGGWLGGGARSGVPSATTPGTMDARMTASKRAAPHLPARTTKITEKLVLLPETAEDREPDEKTADFHADDDDDDETAPLRDDEQARRRARAAAGGGKSYAERLPKARRAEKVARVTAYCTAEAYKMGATADFVRTKHHARTKLYDDCLYCVYHLPLLPGPERYRIRSSPVLRSPGGKSVLDEEIERNEQSSYHDDDDNGYFDERSERRETHHRSKAAASGAPGHHEPVNGGIAVISSANAPAFAELFVFSYGVVVFWNLTERQEKDLLADLTFSRSETGVSLVARPQREEDFETEELHFEYAADIARPRVFNDMITLRSGDHMIKLAMSHAIAQSTKLSFFEEQMAHTMEQAQYIPRRLALTGKLGMKREEVVRILGRLFKSRVDVNLSSNMLDVPNFFWESEPTLHPLYNGVREYLEIKSRVQVLNERCRVFLDLAEILSDSIADQKMSKITWIIIGLIFLSIAVTCSEVFLRFGILTTRPKSLAQYVLWSGLGFYRLASVR
ncbi:MAG: hypothetical protein M1826_007702 [Phylliscum demangeonii]|nr:MAG: hypothetical protein M1826_007702 [Phylliscum demangeonii]